MLFANAATAAQIKIQWDAVITSTFGGFPAPQTFASTFVYDLDNLVSSSGTLKTFGLVSGETTFGGNTYSTSTGTITFQDQVPFTPPRDRVNGSASFSFAFGAININFVTFSFEGPETVFDIGDVPFILDPSYFPTKTTGVTFTGGTCSGTCAVSGQIQNLQISQIPEPASFALVSLGFAGIGYRRHRIKKSR